MSPAAACRESVIERGPGDVAQSVQNRLDKLYADYLNLLDAYATVQEQCFQNLAAGFLSLAQANFVSSNRRAYGQDHYDQRMQASCTMSVTQQGEGRLGYNFSVKSPPDSTTVEHSAKVHAMEKAAGHSGQEMAKAPMQNPDPVRWFGILVPQALRTCQRHFNATVSDGVAPLASLDSRLKALEIDIRRAKKQINQLCRETAGG